MTLEEIHEIYEKMMAKYAEAEEVLKEAAELEEQYWKAREVYEAKI